MSHLKEHRSPSGTLTRGGVNGEAFRDQRRKLSAPHDVRHYGAEPERPVDQPLRLGKPVQQLGGPVLDASNTARSQMDSPLRGLGLLGVLRSVE